MFLKSYAKINLYLNIIKKTYQFHQIDSLFSYINLYDEIIIEENNKNILKSNYNIATDKNIIQHTINNFNCKYGVKKKFKIIHNKNIPIGSGMGGGSSNAAVIIKYLYDFYKIKEDFSNKILFAKELGSDIPFFLQNNCRYIGGIGDVILDKCEILELPIILINPRKINITKKIFKLLKKEDFNIENTNKINNFPNIKTFFDYLKQQKNSLYKSAIKECPEIEEITSFLKNENDAFIQLSGSGATSFLICSDLEIRDYFYKKLLKKFPNFLIIKSNLLNKI